MNTKRLTCVALIAATAAFTSTTQAATNYFDGGAVDIATVGNGSSSGGAGTWDTTILNWDQGSGLDHVAWNNANNDDAVIAGFNTLTVGEAVTVGVLTLNIGSGTRVISTTNGSAITVNSGIKFGNVPGLTWTAPIILGGDQTWTFHGNNTTRKKIETGGTDLNGYTLTWHSTNVSGDSGLYHKKIIGNGSVVKNGTGWINISGNTYTGSTTVNAGSIGMGDATALGNTNNQLTVNGGTLGMSSYNLTVGNLTGTNGVISGSSGTRTLTIGSGDAGGGNFQGLIQDGAGGTTAIKKIGTGTITLSGTNSYTGSTTISNGTLVLTGTLGGNVTVAEVGSLSPVAGGAGTLTIGGNLDISAMADGDGKLLFELGAPGAGDQMAVSGTVTIGTGVLGLSDFDFTNIGGMGAGTYILITSGGGIVGTLNSSDLSGSISGQTSKLQMNGSNLELVVIPSGTLMYIK